MKNTFQRKTTLVLSGALSLSLLAGCVGVNNNSSESGSSENDSQPVEGQEITLMTNDSTRPEWTQYEEQIEEATGVELNVIASPTNPDDMVAKMTTILSSGDQSVDLMHVNDELITAFSRAGYLAPLEEDVMTEGVVSNFAEQYMKDIPSYEGSIYSVPSYLEVLAFWVNNELLQQAGMEAPKTKEEFMAYAKAVTSGDTYGYGGAWEKSYVFNEIGTFINLFGGDYFDWTNPKTQEALKFMYDLAHTEKVTPVSQLADIYDPMIQKFIDGKYGMLFMYTGAIPTFEDAGKFSEDQLSIEPMPTFETNDAFVASWHYVLNGSSEKQKAAKAVLSYIASPEGQLAYSEMSGRLPAHLDLINDPDFEGKGVEEVREYIANGALRGRPLVPQSMEFVNAIGSLFQQYISNDLTLEEVVEKAQQEIDRLAV